MERRPITDVLAEVTPRLMALPGVVGTYEGALPDGTPCIKVVVVGRPESVKKLPREIEGYRVIVVRSDEIRAMPDSSG